MMKTLHALLFASLLVALPLINLFAQNVGIGTANPLTKLQVSGQITTGTAFNPTVGSASNNNLINILVGTDEDGATNGIGFYEFNTFGMKIGYDGTGSAAANALRIYDNTDAPLMTFENGGEFGIGTTTPSATVDLVQNSGSGILELSTATNGEFMVFGATDNAANMRSWIAPNDGGGLDFTKEFGFDPDINGAAGAWYFERDVVMATAGGNVGIGTTAPTQILDVNGQVRIRGGAPADGRVLTATNANGDAQWEEAYTPPPTDYYSSGNTTTFTGSGVDYCASSNGTCGVEIQSITVTNNASVTRRFRVYSTFGLKADDNTDDFRHWIDDGPSGCQRYDQRETKVWPWGGDNQITSGTGSSRWSRAYNEMYYNIAPGATWTFRQKIFQSAGGCAGYKTGYMVAYPVN